MTYNSYVRKEEIDGANNLLWLVGENGVWEGPSKEWPRYKEFYLEHCRQFKVAVQAGGALGLYPRLLSQMFERVYTFEPDPRSFHFLVNNNQNDNVYKINAALGDFNILVTLKRENDQNVGMNKVKINESNATVPQFTIDQLALDHCDLIQLDIEGYEINALQGAFDTITKFKPVIQVENATNEIRSMMEMLKYKQVAEHAADKIFAPIL